MSSDEILMRTGQHRNLAFNQLFFWPATHEAPGPTIWFDDFKIATGRP